MPECLGKLLELPTCTDERGELSFAEGLRQLPFSIERIYWVYNVPEEAQRGGHAHLNCEVVLVAMNGTFSVTLDNGREQHCIVLDTPNKGLYIPKGVWRTLTNFSAGAVCMAMASQPYDENDYVRDYEEFLKIATCLK